jgi:hypothetical protein
MIGRRRFDRVRFGLLGACASLVLFAVVPAVASAGGGNSGNAKLCQKGGWQHLARADGTPFVNAADCVSYAAQGGTLIDPRGPTALYCDRVGGTFGSTLLGDANNQTGPAPQGGFLDFTCNGAALTPSDQAVFSGACAADAVADVAYSSSFVYLSTVPASSCFLFYIVTS